MVCWLRHISSLCARYSLLHHNIYKMPCSGNHTTVAVHMNTTWTPHEHHMNTTWTRREHHVDTMWTPREHHVNTTWTPREHHVNTMWTLCEHHVNTMWTLCEHHVNTMWTLCEHVGDYVNLGTSFCQQPQTEIDINQAWQWTWYRNRF